MVNKKIRFTLRWSLSYFSLYMMSWLTAETVKIIEAVALIGFVAVLSKLRNNLTMNRSIPVS